MKFDPAKYVPLGIDAKRAFVCAATFLAVSVVYSMGFLFRYLNYYGELFIWQNGEKILAPDQVMADFNLILDGYLNGFIVTVIFMIGTAAYYYIYHYHGGSKSIYTMRRLPSRMELWKRCLAIPAATILSCALLAFILTLVYFGVYMLFTPDECLAPDQWQKLWNFLK